MRKLVCDCCGKDITGKDITIKNTDYDEPSSRLIIFDDYEDDELDLCNKCTKRVKDFIQMKWGVGPKED